MIMGIAKFATTFQRGFQDARFSSQAEMIYVPQYLDIIPARKFRLKYELQLLLGVLKAAFRFPALLLFSSRGYLKPELMAIILLGFIPRRWRPAIVLYGEMYEPDTGLSGFIQRIVMKLVDRGVDLYIVYSSAELEIFPRIWGVEVGKLRFCPMFCKPPEGGASLEKREDCEFIFSAGNSFRDYEPLIEVAKQLPEYKFYLATVRLNQQAELPHNITVEWPSMEDYLHLIATSKAVVVPLQLGLNRTVGLLTAFETMILEQVLIISDAVGIRDYVLDGETGLVVDGTTEGYLKAIRWVMSPENAGKVAKMRRNARKAVLEQFTQQNHVRCVLGVMEEALEIKRTA